MTPMVPSRAPFSIALLLVPRLLVPPPHGCIRPHDTRMVIKNVEGALVHFQTESEVPCPASLEALVEARILSRLPVDAWGKSLVFTCPGAHNPDGADVVSAGRDRVLGTADDLHSWD